jgi:hypothetical protein
MNPTPGTAVQIFPCHGGSDQKWTLTSNGEIRGLGGLCLDVRAGDTTDGTPVQVFTCHGGPSERWQFVGKSMEVSFYIDQMAAHQVTDGDSTADRDEVYILSRGSLPGGFISERLPRYPSGDDYYEFFTNRVAASQNLAQWTNQDQAPIGKPVFWAGHLAHNQAGAFLIILGEQDNKDLAAIKQVILGSLNVLGTVVGGIAGPAGPAVTAAVSAATAAAGSLPDTTKDDVIGAFAVQFKNNDGELQTTWLALPNIQIRQGQSGSTTMLDTTNPFALARRDFGFETAVFNMSATGGGSYQVAATLELNPRSRPTAWQYLGRVGGFDPIEGLVSGRCNRPQPVKVQGRAGSVLMADNPRAVPVIQPEFGWLCASSQEGSECRSGTNLVVGERGAG